MAKQKDRSADLSGLPLVTPETFERVKNIQMKKTAPTGAEIMGVVNAETAEKTKLPAGASGEEGSGEEVKGKRKEETAAEFAQKPQERKQVLTDLAGEAEILLTEPGLMETPEDGLQIRQMVESMTPTDLKQNLAAEILKTRRLSRWANLITARYKQAIESGSDRMNVPILPAGMKEALGMGEDKDTEATVKAAKAVMPMIMQWRLIREALKEDNEPAGGDRKQADEGRIKFKNVDGTEIELPSSQVPPWLYGQLMQRPGAGGTEGGGKDEMVTIKVGDKEISAPKDQVGWMYHTIFKDAEKQASVTIKGVDGVEREVPVNALGALMDWNRMMTGGGAGQQESGGSDVIEITDPSGNTLRIPAAYYPWYMQQQMMQQQRQVGGGGYAGGSQVDTGRSAGTRGADAGTMATMARMNDAIAKMTEILNPDNIGKMAVRGMRAQMEEFAALKSLIGGGSEDPETARERLKQDKETERLRIQEDAKVRVAEEKRLQAQAEADKFAALMSPSAGMGVGMMPGGQAPPMQGAPALQQTQKPSLSFSDVVKRSRDLNMAFEDRMKTPGGVKKPVSKPFAESELAVDELNIDGLDAESEPF
jgi:hypothetical protein